MLAVRTLRQTKELFKEPPHLHCPGHGDSRVQLKRVDFQKRLTVRLIQHFRRRGIVIKAQHDSMIIRNFAAIDTQGLTF